MTPHLVTVYVTTAAVSDLCSSTCHLFLVHLNFLIQLITCDGYTIVLIHFKIASFEKNAIVASHCYSLSSEEQSGRWHQPLFYTASGI